MPRNLEHFLTSRLNKVVKKRLFSEKILFDKKRVFLHIFWISGSRIPGFQDPRNTKW